MQFFILYAHKIRKSIIINIAKLLLCHSLAYGYKTFQCPSCGTKKKVSFSYHSRACSSCGKKATDTWVNKNYSILPKTAWQNITFTLPKELQILFWCNRFLMNLFPKLAAHIILDLAAKKKVFPGIFLAIHTFGKDLKQNFHCHLVTTCGDLTLRHEKYYWKRLYFHHEILKAKWRYIIVTLLRQQYKLGNLTLPTSLSFITNYDSFNAWLNQLYQKQWVVHLTKPTTNHKY